MARRLALALCGLALLGGCGSADPSLPFDCREGADAVGRALQAAPDGRVALSGGTLLSTCVHRALSTAQAQDLAIQWTRAADRLAARLPRDDQAAARLGFLIGAARRGAAETNGVQEELVRRLEQTPGVTTATAPRRAAYERGVALGQQRG